MWAECREERIRCYGRRAMAGLPLFDGVPWSLTSEFASTDYISLRVSTAGVVSGWKHGDADFANRVDRALRRGDE